MSFAFTVKCHGLNVTLYSEIVIMTTKCHWILFRCIRWIRRWLYSTGRKGFDGFLAFSLMFWTKTHWPVKSDVFLLVTLPELKLEHFRQTQGSLRVWAQPMRDGVTIQRRLSLVKPISFQVWAQPMRDDLTMQRRLPLAEPISLMITETRPTP